MNFLVKVGIPKGKCAKIVKISHIAVQEDVLEKRSKKNTITFTGQALTFIVEVTYIILMQLLIQFGRVGGFFEPGILPCLMMAAMAIVTSSQILASPELRRFIQGYD